MESITLGKSGVISPRLVYGCMRLAGDNSTAARERGRQAIRAALDEGYTHFDHADIYGGGACETLFAEVMAERPGLRDRLLITSKCGIRGRGKPNPDDPVRYDFSKSHLLASVDGSLGRLKTDYLDLLLLHRPDHLFRAEEVWAAFSALRAAGKVRHFGVSNFRPPQVSLLASRCPFPLLVNQVEINIHNLDTLLDGTLDQAQELGITPQAWCPLGGVAYPAWRNTFSQETEARIRAELDAQGRTYGAEPWIVMLAWLLRHPAKIVPIIGTTTSARIKAAKQALTLDYSREDWYRLLEARNGHPVP